MKISLLAAALLFTLGAFLSSSVSPSVYYSDNNLEKTYHFSDLCNGLNDDHGVHTTSAYSAEKRGMIPCKLEE